VDFRHCYTYVLPGPGRALSLVGSRDVRFEAFGIETPPQRKSFPYVLNEWRLWHSPDITRKPLVEARSIEAAISPDFLNPQCRAVDAYTDTAGRVHVLYDYSSKELGGNGQKHHAVLKADGTVLKDILLPGSVGGHARIFQDAAGRFHILSSPGVIHLATNEDGTELSDPVRLDLKGYQVDYAGFGLSVPRCGVAPADIVDAVFPSAGGKQWVYFRLRLR
jgi:hypothetical protein